jgi:hypothetical protein
MERIFYEKVGEEYVARSYYDSEVMDAVSLGAHLIVKREGSTSRRCNVDPALAPMIAAGLYAHDGIVAAILEASKLRLPSKHNPITPEQKLAWENLSAAFGLDALPLEWPSYSEIADAGVTALQTEAEKLLDNDSVRAAYDHFILMCKLTSCNNTDE